MNAKEIKIEFIAHGAVMTATYEDCTPTEIIDSLKAEDDGVKFRDAFFTRGGKGGNRDTKSAIAQSITVKKYDGKASIDIVAVTGDGEAITVRVGKKSIDQYPDALYAVVSGNAEKEAKKAFSSDKGGTVLLMDETSKFTVKYFDIDGSCYVDSLEAASND